MNDTEKEIKELTDKVHTYKLKNDIILAVKYLIYGFSITLVVILLSSVFI